MFSLRLKSALQYNHGTELVEDCIVFTTVCVLHTARAAASRFAGAVLDELKGFLQ